MTRSGSATKLERRVYVVVEETATRVINDVFDAADFYRSEIHDAFDGVDYFARRFIGFHREAVFCGFYRATGAALQFFACRALADVARAKVVGFSSGGES